MWILPRRLPLSLRQGRLRRPHRCTPGWVHLQTTLLIQLGVSGLPVFQTCGVCACHSGLGQGFEFQTSGSHVYPGGFGIFRIWDIIAPIPWASDQVVKAATGTDDRRVVKEASSFGDSTLS